MYTSFYARGLGLQTSARESIELAARHGFEAVDLMVRDLDGQSHSPTALRRLMDDLGVRGGAWALPVDWRSGLDVFNRDLKVLPRLAATASELGLARTSTWVLPAGLLPGITDGPNLRDRLIDAHADRLGRIARILTREGTRLGLEVVGVETFREGRGEPFLHRLTDPSLRVLIDRLNATLPAGSPGVGILLDTFHLHAANETIEQALSLFDVGSVVWVHAADLPLDVPGDRSKIVDHDRALPGETGFVPCADILTTLAKSGYIGPVSAEPLAGCRRLQGLDVDETARLCANAMRRVWPTVRETDGGTERHPPAL